MSVCVCLCVLGGLSGAGFAGFFGIFGMGGPAGTGALVRALEESLRAFTRDHERLRVFTWVGRIVWSRICRIFWDFQDGGGPADAGGLVRALDVRLRAFTRDHESLRVLGGLPEAGFAGFIGIFRMGEDLLTQVGSYERWTRDCERLREITSVCGRLRVLGGLSGAGFAGFIGIFRIGEDLLTQVRSYERWMRVCERLRVFTRDWYGWFLWVDHKMGRISCIQTDAGCFVQSMRGSSVGVRWSGL